MSRIAREKARSYLESLITSCQGKGETRLPNYEILARSAGVSPRTMLKSLRELRDQGVLSLSHGTGTTIRAAAPAGARATEGNDRTEPGTLWARTALRIYRDILGGRYGRGATLPSLKELESRYGTTDRTLRRALNDLRRKGLVFEHKRRHRICSVVGPEGPNSIVLVAFGGEQRGSQITRFGSQRCDDHLHSLQIACRQAYVEAAFKSAGGECLLVVPASQGETRGRPTLVDVSGLERQGKALLADFRLRHDRLDGFRYRVEDEMLLHIDCFAERRALRDRLRTSLLELETREDITAWIGYNDTVAVMCLDHLAISGRRVPRDIAVIGMDDGPDALYNNLTSYNFNGDAYMRAMVEHILRPGVTAALGSVAAFDGFVTERETA